MRRSLVPCAVLMLAAAASCENQTFNSASAKLDPPQLVRTQCNALGKYADEELVFNAPKKKETQLFIQGEFCPLAPAQLRIVFVVDFSLSMYNKDANPVRGSDPVKDGSCGRLAAAKALIENQLKSLKDQKAEIKVATIPFASELLDGVPLTDIAAFQEKELTTDNFCQGVTKTNYKVAAEATVEMLKDEPGKKLVFFLTDGLPTKGGDGPEGNYTAQLDAAKDAGKELRDGIEDLTFNTVFLKPSEDGANTFDDKSVTAPEFYKIAQDFLEDFTGDKKRVKIVANPEELADAVIKLENPPVELDTTTFKAVVTAPGAPKDEQVYFGNVEKTAGKEQTWSFKTQAFKAFPGEPFESTLTITAKDVKGQEFNVSFKIKPLPEGQTQTAESKEPGAPQTPD